MRACQKWECIGNQATGSRQCAFEAATQRVGLLIGSWRLRVVLILEPLLEGIEEAHRRHAWPCTDSRRRGSWRRTKSLQRRREGQRGEQCKVAGHFVLSQSVNQNRRFGRLRRTRGYMARFTQMRPCKIEHSLQYRGPDRV